MSEVDGSVLSVGVLQNVWSTGGGGNLVSVKVMDLNQLSARSVLEMCVMYSPVEEMVGLKSLWDEVFGTRSRFKIHLKRSKEQDGKGETTIQQTPHTHHK